MAYLITHFKNFPIIKNNITIRNATGGLIFPRQVLAFNNNQEVQVQIILKGLFFH